MSELLDAAKVESATGEPHAPAVADQPRTAPRARRGAGAAIASVASALPRSSVPTAEIAARLGVTEQWVVDRTGIHARHFAAPDETLTELATQAGARALELAGVAAGDVDLILLATTTADHIMPTGAPLVAERLGAVHAGGMDIGAVCAGFVSALSVGAGAIESGRAGVVLVIGADILSRITDPNDRRTAALFADAAGAVVMVASDGPSRVGEIVLRADGTGIEWIIATHEERVIRMAGHETFKHAVARLSEVTLEALAAAGMTTDDIDLFVYHQANARILRALGERLGLPPEKIVDAIGDVGNTSSASIPLALCAALDDGRLRPSSRLLLGAFGAGFVWGAGTVQWGLDG